MKQPELTTTRKSPRFNLGQIYFTPGIIELIDRLQIDPFELLVRHRVGDWGNVCKEDAQSNEDAIRYGTRILSAYKLD